MEKQDIKVLYIVLRYLLILLFGLGNFYLIYKIFAPITVYLSYFMLSIFYNPVVLNNVIFINNYEIEIISSCIAGSAYFFLLGLNLSVPMDYKKRIYTLFCAVLIFLSLNVLRIVFLSSLFINDCIYFDVIHKFLWWFFSTFLILFIWFSEVLIFKIKPIPIYSDFKFVKRLIK
ncbi:MAG: pacearchaeosortase [Candidatus Pacearchaeota archaeon]